MILTAEEFRKKNRKTVSLSSGDEIQIRKIKASECALKCGAIPASFWDKGTSGDGGVDADTEVPAEEMNFRNMFTVAVITSGVISPKVVDKEIGDCAEDEISIHELTDDMQNEILREILKFNKADRGASGEVARFQE